MLRLIRFTDIIIFFVIAALISAFPSPVNDEPARPENYPAPLPEPPIIGPPPKPSDISVISTHASQVRHPFIPELRIPEHIKELSKRVDCKPSTLIWLARKIHPDPNNNDFENYFSFNVRDTFFCEFPWKEDANGLQFQRSGWHKDGLEVMIFYRNQTIGRNNIYINWLGKYYYYNRASYTNANLYYREYWDCVPPAFTL